MLWNLSDSRQKLHRLKLEYALAGEGRKEKRSLDRVLVCYILLLYITPLLIFCWFSLHTCASALAVVLHRVHVQRRRRAAHSPLLGAPRRERRYGRRFFDR